MAWFNKWARWYLGLYEYEGYRRDKSVRPTAPRRIPLSAWLLLVKKLPAIRAEKRGRAAVSSFWDWGVKNQLQIHYQERRPMENLRSPGKLKNLPRYADCSEFFTDAYSLAGLPDPNGNAYNGWGNTDTLWVTGKPIGKSQLRPGDAVIFGKYPGTVHVCVVRKRGSDPLLGSHGTEAGPLYLKLSKESSYHAGQAISYRRYIKAAI